MRFVYNISIMAYTSSSDLQVYSSYSWDWLWRIWDAHFTLCRLSPRLFGEPTNRDRWWRILFDEKKYQWNCAYSFAELTEILLLPPQTPLTVTPEVFFWARPAEIATENSELCPSAIQYLEDYKNMTPNKNYFDLASNPRFVQRTETKDGSLMTLTTNTRIWTLSSTLECLGTNFSHVGFTKNREPNFALRNRKRGRVMLAKEMISTLGYPSHPRSSNDLGTESRVRKEFQKYYACLFIMHSE